MLLRILRYRVSLDVTTSDELYDLEFAHEPQPQLSVYDSDGPGRIEQVQCEHSASAKDKDPPRFAAIVDVDPSGRKVVVDPPDSPFKYLRGAHSLIDTSTMAEVRAFSDEVFATMQDRTKTFFREKGVLRAYVAARVTASDPEWTDFLSAASDKWKKFPKA